MGLLSLKWLYEDQQPVPMRMTRCHCLNSKTCGFEPGVQVSTMILCNRRTVCATQLSWLPAQWIMVMAVRLFNIGYICDAMCHELGNVCNTYRNRTLYIG